MAWRIDAFSLDWSEQKLYAFPPVSIILRTLRNIADDEAEGIVVVPHWPTEAYYPLFLKLANNSVLYLNPSTNVLSFNDRPHPLHQPLSLAAGHLSGKHCKSYK
jgi:hypothetical protein